ncbi:hypothetical protein [Desulfosporosinus sp.]|uniref:hypothetical protein n=1 Tax=Desulfosporosinus sp. TaxID=157907 RepID=UPI00231D380B|nr:hypothetical protein [Desulfosporosinus sp.]MCO5387456.1 hypothetical protein [Desulfosporosinus sp.]MDA8220844.1 hypothetical protein [Desulfitobacterium hafniense]
MFAHAALNPNYIIFLPLRQNGLTDYLKEKKGYRLQSISNADQIIVLERGEVKDGKPRRIVEKGGFYAHMWEEQSRAGNWNLVRPSE